MKLDIDQINQVKPTENAMELFKLVASRFVNSFSIQKNCRTFEAGLKEGSKQLNDVHNSMDLAFQDCLVEGDSINASYIFEKLGPGKKETAILLSKNQLHACCGELSSSFIYGGFGTGKTELAIQVNKKFCDHVIEKFASRGLVIVSIFSDRGYCDKLMKNYTEMLDACLTTQGQRDDSLSQSLSTMVCVKD